MFISNKDYKNIIDEANFEIKKLKNQLYDVNKQLREIEENKKVIENDYNYIKNNNRDAADKIYKLEEELRTLKLVEHLYIIKTEESIEKIKGYFIIQEWSGNNLKVIIKGKNNNVIASYIGVKSYIVNS